MQFINVKQKQTSITMNVNICNHFETVNQLTTRDAYLRKRCDSVYRYQRILPDPLKNYTNLKLFVFNIASVYDAEIYFLLPKIPLLPRLA